MAIEARGAPTIPLVLEAMSAARKNDADTVTECLSLFAQRILDLGDLLGRMYEHCSPRAFYFRIRPFLAGSKNMAEAGLPNGVILEDGSGAEEYRQYSGGSNAQSSLIQFFDIALGIEHRPTGVKKDTSESQKEGTAPPARHNFLEVRHFFLGSTRRFTNDLQEMRQYMPGPHRRFLEHLKTVSNIRDYVESNLHNIPLSSAYDQCLSALSSFRDKHLQIVSRYIVIMAAESKRKAAVETQTPKPALIAKKEPPQHLVGLARGEPGKAGLTGTGGTQLMPFLKQSRDETLEPATGAHKIEHSLDRAMARRDVGVAPIILNSGVDSKPLSGFCARSCKVNDFEDVPVPRVTGVGMAGDWEVGDDVGGICHS